LYWPFQKSDAYVDVHKGGSTARVDSGKGVKNDFLVDVING